MRCVKFGLFMVISSLLFESAVQAQGIDTSDHNTADTLQPVCTVPSSPVKTAPSGKNFSAATVKLVTNNLIPFSINHFVRHMDFAAISLQSLSTNLSLRSWEWDADQFLNNQFSHPYHGSLYFNSFRSEGYSFWQSVPATFAGSLLWEIAGEKDRPAINDLINTTLGGIAWGEMTHRLALRFTEHWRSGKKKNVLDILGIVVDPMNGVSNLLNKNRRLSQRWPMDTTPIRFELSGGSRQYNRELNNVRQTTRGEWFTRLHLDYGTPINPFTKPFSYFSVLTELGTSDSSVFNIARIRGSLAGKNLYRSGQSYHSALLTLEYDYYKNSAFRYGMQSLQLGLVSRFRIIPQIVLHTELGANLIGLAAVSVDDQYDGRKRNYDYCSGGGFTASGNVMLLDRLGFRTDVRLGWLTTLDGKNSNYRVTNSTSAIRGQLKKNLFLEYEWGHFFMKSHSDHLPKQVKHTFYKRVSVGYQFQL